MKSREKMLDEQIVHLNQIIVNRNRDLRKRDEKIASLEEELAIARDNFMLCDMPERELVEKLEIADRRADGLEGALKKVMEIEQKRNHHLGRPRVSGIEKECIICIIHFALNQE